jgi:ABC-2 type transport system ATP-binding protein
VSFVEPAAVTPPDLAGERTAEGRREITTDNLTATLHELTGWALEAGIELEDLQILRPTLEDIYLEVTGGAAALRDPEPAVGRSRRSRRGARTGAGR